MDLFNSILMSAILAETSILVWRSYRGGSRGNQTPRRKVFIDTSVLMDGRILAVAKTGFLGDELYIPRSVIRELQLLADGSDAEKRTRARYGLDIANELTHLDCANVEIYPDETTDRVKVDERLMELAKQNQGVVLTIDFNLVKVAATEKIEALNVNDLAQSLRSEFLPGDKLNVKIIGVGSNPRQGVAYLPDGTMVVVDDAEKYAGRNEVIEIEFVRYLQTNAGKMMFAKQVKENRAPKTTAAQKVVKAAKGRKKPAKKNKQQESQNTKIEDSAAPAAPKEAQGANNQKNSKNKQKQQQKQKQTQNKASIAEMNPVAVKKKRKRSKSTPEDKLMSTIKHIDD